MSCPSEEASYEPSLQVGDSLIHGAVGLLEENVASSPRADRQPVRVLHLINGEHYAGAERVQDLLALSLPAEGYEVGFACLKPGRFAAARKSQNSPLYTLGMKSRFDWRPVRNLAKLVERENYQIIHSHTSRSALLGLLAAKMAGVPLVHHIHSSATPDTLRDFRDRVSAHVERVGFRRAAAVIAVSPATADYAVRGGAKPERVTMVPNGVPTVDRLSEKRRPSEDWSVGTVALFRERKGLEVLIDALARLRQQFLPVRLRIVGPFETAAYEARVRQHVDQLGLTGAIEWRGFQENISAELAAMDLFVMPSVLREGLPMVILEAMAAGVPLIGSSVEGIPDVIRDNIDGLLVTPGDPDDLARAIARVVRGEVDTQKLRTSAYERQVTRYSDRSMAAGVAAVYADVLARRPSRRTAQNA